MFSQTPQLYSMPLSLRGHVLNDQQSNSSGAGRKNHNVTLCQNTKQSEEMAQLRTDNKNLQRELELMKENINLNSQVTAAPILRGTSYSRVPPDVSISFIYLVTWCACNLGLPYHFYSTFYSIDDGQIATQHVYICRFLRWKA